MNVFVLNAGRCGSTTFAAACSHITNFACGHETRMGLIGHERLDYPADHIEIDNRLAWILGRLHRAYGDDAFYVHLKRDTEATAKSYLKRYQFGIIRAYREGVLLSLPEKTSPMSVALDYCDTIDSNIELYLRDKTRTMDFRLENARRDFPRFWHKIGAEGDLDAALAEFDVLHNAAHLDYVKAYTSGDQASSPPLWDSLRRHSRELKGRLRNYIGRS